MNKLWIAIAVVSLGLLVWGSIMIRGGHYQGKPSPVTVKNIDQMQRLLIYGRQARATYDDITPKEHKKGDKYSFSVYGKDYPFTVELDEAPQTTNFDVQYLLDTPTVHSIDPKQELEALRQQLATETEGNNVSITIWIVWVIGVAGLLYSLKRLVVKKT